MKLVEILLWIFIALVIATLVLTYLLYKTVNDEGKHRLVFIANLVLALIVSFLAYSSLPDNYTSQRIIAFVWLGLAGVSAVLKFVLKQKTLTPEILLSIATFGALAQTLFI